MGKIIIGYQCRGKNAIAWLQLQLKAAVLKVHLANPPYFAGQIILITTSEV